ncbi:Glycoprotein-N-acetylgalactosamine 3-beta-galactosyltransferase 1 [Armadillidium vulgare]|nr:Glycoprotein-N-acetylgalactosamine 3-beta-galactosyltransferase 1 [Armadillidium vulgare]
MTKDVSRSLSPVKYKCSVTKKLFYFETYLPTPNLPVQHRRENLEFAIGGEKDSKILCLISTSPKYHQTRAVHVAATWARHCSRAVFLTSEADASLADSYVNSEARGYYNLWEKISKAFLWVYDENLLSSYEWVLKVDDDTFVFVENLISSLKPYDPNHLIAAGHKLYTWETNEVYLNGGAGYVLSKAAVARLVTKGLRNNICEKNLKMGSGEDVNMALCLTYIGMITNN